MKINQIEHLHTHTLTQRTKSRKKDHHRRVTSKIVLTSSRQRLAMPTKLSSDLRKQNTTPHFSIVFYPLLLWLNELFRTTYAHSTHIVWDAFFFLSVFFSLYKKYKYIVLSLYLRVDTHSNLLSIRELLRISLCGSFFFFTILSNHLTRI